MEEEAQNKEKAEENAKKEEEALQIERLKVRK